MIALLGIAVLLKHFAGNPAAVSILGPIHGMAFLSYLWLILKTVSSEEWSKSEIARLLIAAVIPFGAFFNAGFLARKDEVWRESRAIDNT